MYPHILRAFGISKETTVSDMLKIYGENSEEINILFSNLCASDENAVFIGSRYLGLAGYDDILDRIAM